MQRNPHHYRDGHQRQKERPGVEESLEAGQGFTDNEVTLVIDGRSHILSVTAQRMPDGMILLEMAPMDNQRRLSQEQLQHAQQVAARDLVRGRLVPSHQAIHLLQIAREALSNALKHSQASEVVVTVAQNDNQVKLTVQDNGCGVPENAIRSNHYGMIIMRDRAQICSRIILSLRDASPLFWRLHARSHQQITHRPHIVVRAYPFFPVRINSTQRYP